MTIKQYKQWLFVEVMEGSFDHSIWDEDGILALISQVYMPDFMQPMPVPVKLPPGSYSSPVLLRDASEELAREVVDREDGDRGWCPTYNDPDSGGRGFCYEDYSNEDFHSVVYTALASLHSLVRSLGMGENLVIIKIENV